MKTFALHTLGCKVNQSEGEIIKSVLNEAGLAEKDFKVKTDLKIINSCSVTAQADAKSRQLVHKALSNSGEVYVTGCSAENPQSNVKSNDVILISNIDKINFFKDKFSVDSFDKKYFRSRPLVKIQDGCSQKCSYCIVPNLRGDKPVSVGHDEVLNNIKKIIDNGFSEIILTGVNIGLYKSGNLDLDKLLKTVNKIDKDFRVRLSSIELNTISEGIIKEIFLESSKIVKHLHIPLQSGSNKVLKAMNRPYKINDFFKLTNKIKSLDADFCLTTDCIVGYPGETDEDFRQTLNAVEQINFSKVHVFKYSKRPGTYAELSEVQISEETKKERSKKLQELAEAIREKYLEAQSGKTREVLAEKYMQGFIYGLSDNYLKVKFKGSKCLLKKLVSVRIQKVSDGICQGELLK